MEKASAVARRLYARRGRCAPALLLASGTLTLAGTPAALAAHTQRHAPGKRSHRAAVVHRARRAAPRQSPQLTATVLGAQRLFRELGYPLGSDLPGELGVGTRGALGYFQRKYGLGVSGLPDAATLALMASVASAQRAAAHAGPGPIELVPAATAPVHGHLAATQAQPQDLIERLLGDRLPFFAIAIALAGMLALLALSARPSRRYDSGGPGDSPASARGEG